MAPWHPFLAAVLLVGSSCTDAAVASSGPAPVPAEHPRDPPKTRGPATLTGGRAARSDDERAAQSRLEKSAQALLAALAKRLGDALGDAGAWARATRVCALEAQALTADVASAQGVALGRTSLRLRNAERNAAPAWVRPWLEAHRDRSAAEAQPAAGIFEVGERRVARFVAPIGIAPLCLNCHGPTPQIPEDVRSILAQHYPTDEATGYALGDLRGAVWAEIELGDSDAG